MEQEQTMSRSQRFRFGEQNVEVSARRTGDAHHVVVGERTLELTHLERSANQLRFDLDGTRHQATIARCGKALQVRLDGRTYLLEELTSSFAAASGSAADRVVAPMTGTVLEVLVQPDQDVEADQPLVVITAMKMEHRLTAPRAGRVAELLIRAGDTVQAGAMLVRLA
jgi:3-methylcrotonyl-CoA carboxylase alpha subunit